EIGEFRRGGVSGSWRHAAVRPNRCGGQRRPVRDRHPGARRRGLLAGLMSIFPEGNPNQMYVMTRDYATKNPAVVNAFRAAIDEAAAFIAVSARCSSSRRPPSQV